MKIVPKLQAGYTLIEMTIVVTLLLAVSIIATLGYVAWHFISKFW